MGRYGFRDPSATSRRTVWTRGLGFLEAIRFWLVETVGDQVSGSDLIEIAFENNIITEHQILVPLNLAAKSSPWPPPTLTPSRKCRWLSKTRWADATSTSKRTTNGCSQKPRQVSRWNWPFDWIACSWRAVFPAAQGCWKTVSSQSLRYWNSPMAMPSFTSVAENVETKLWSFERYPRMDDFHWRQKAAHHEVYLLSCKYFEYICRRPWSFHLLVFLEWCCLAMSIFCGRAGHWRVQESDLSDTDSTDLDFWSSGPCGKIIVWRS